jgi:hypothetical protein
MMATVILIPPESEFARTLESGEEPIEIEAVGRRFLLTPK